MTKDVYETIPLMESERFLLRSLNDKKDAEDLLKVYSDEKAVPFFNTDNCHGEDFHYTTMEQMKKAMEFWKFSYQQKFFVRWAIEDKKKKEVIGTIELFHRSANDYYDCCGLLRLDLRSDYEIAEDITEVLSAILPKVKEMFLCDKIATKAVTAAKERAGALETLGFQPSEEPLIGDDGTKYDSYYVMEL
ncbi:MAG: GNAT family N-acetyltransferase [Lachnospiraceae bacterium]|nr:GNAT family N-acetyltransferase [Lachnospiraceae bacterium]